MRRFDPSSAECLVFTYKEGFLSALAHDLKIRVTRFEIEVDEDARVVEARFDAGSLRVVCAMRDGEESPRTLSTENKREIERSISNEVLHARDFPQITFSSTSVQDGKDGYLVKGTLALHGRGRQVAVRVRHEGDALRAEARLHQPDFGIRPYSALLGTLKVQSDVTVQVTVRASG